MYHTKSNSSRGFIQLLIFGIFILGFRPVESCVGYSRRDTNILAHHHNYNDKIMFVVLCALLRITIRIQKNRTLTQFFSTSHHHVI